MKTGSHRKKFTQLAILVLKLLVASALLFWLIQSGQLNFSLLVSSPVNTVFVLGIFTLALHILFQIIRWWVLFRAQGQPIKLGYAIRITLIGQFFAVFMPGNAGVDVVRMYYVVRDSREGRIKRASTVILDRGIGLYVMLLLGGVALLAFAVRYGELSSALLQVGGVVSGALFIATLGGALLWFERSRHFILMIIPLRFRLMLHDSISAYRQAGSLLWLCVGFSLAANVMIVATFVCAGHWVDTPIPWNEALLVVPIIIIASLLPITPGGIGVAEAVSAFFFGQFGIESGAVIMLIIRFWDILLRLPGGILYILDAWSGKNREHASPVKLS